MRTTQIMTVSLPPEMVTRFEAVRKAESRTRSELVREALRTYFEARYPTSQPTEGDLSAIRRGRAAFRRGDFAPLKEALRELESGGRRSRPKADPKASRKGSRQS
jgi:predicted transcriptional regulator